MYALMYNEHGKWWYCHVYGGIVGRYSMTAVFDDLYSAQAELLAWQRGNPEGEYKVVEVGLQVI